MLTQPGRRRRRQRRRCEYEKTLRAWAPVWRLRDTTQVCARARLIRLLSLRRCWRAGALRPSDTHFIVTRAVCVRVRTYGHISNPTTNLASACAGAVRVAVSESVCGLLRIQSCHMLLSRYRTRRRRRRRLRGRTRLPTATSGRYVSLTL